jgi:Arc/MetJ-type ribon-helix-helix transcriptional regulator
MHVELSPEAQERVESLVASGAYPSVEAAVEAAVDALSCPLCDEGSSELDDELDAQAEADIAAGRVRPVDDAFVAELRAYVEDQIRAKQA